MKTRKIPKKVLEQTQKGFERIERGEGISEKEFLKRLKKLQDKRKHPKKK
ncbi:MAG: hypothetical protein Q7K16_02660 [Candidatus Azambacteria bacterium]|nr:hypothetical protein [Candidatus Azambacteria bacterium]